MKLDLHIHSKYSFDSISDPKKIVDIARKKGLDAIAITDHNTIKGSLIGRKFSKDIMVICGSEIGTDKGDILGLFLNEEIKKRTYFEAIDEIKDQDGIAVLAHPFKRINKFDEEILKKIDAIEGFNARAGSSANAKAVKFGSRYGIPMTGGSDAHFYFEIGRGRTIIGDVDDSEDVRKAILGGNTYLRGEPSSTFLDYYSQIIKIFKTKRIPKLHKVKKRLVKEVLG